MNAWGFSIVVEGVENSKPQRERAMSFPVETLIERLEFYVLKRQIGLAELMAQEFQDECSPSPFKEAGYVILSVVTAYFEMITQFIKGVDSHGKSQAFFILGFKEVYGAKNCLTDKQIEQLYRVVRCGMYHGGMTKVGCHLSRYFVPGVHVCNSEIHINPAAMVQEIKEHFCQYLDQLRDTANTTLRANFVTMCSVMGLDRDNRDFTICITPSGNRMTGTTPDPSAKGDSGPTHYVPVEE